MVNSINFVREQRRRLGRQQQLDLKVFRSVSLAGGVAVALLVVSVAVRILMGLQVQAAINQQNQQLAIITAQAENERSYVTFATKLTTLSELFTNRRNKQEAIAFFSTLFDNTVLINAISYRADDNQLIFGMQTQNVFSLDRVINILSSQDVKNRFAAISYEELNRGENGEYQLKVIVSLKPEVE